MDTLHFELEYEWKAFTVAGEHLTFAQLAERQLYPNECSHWGAAVYKWEGLFTFSEYSGKTGILIGETIDIKERIREYATATAKIPFLYRHRAFLAQGVFRLFIFRVHAATLGTKEPKLNFEEWFFSPPQDRRMAYKELLVANQGLKRQPQVIVMS